MNVNALNADFKVAVLGVQKLIKQKEVNPINSHPKNNIIVLPEVTKKIILMTKVNKNSKNLSTRGSCLRYENAYTNTNRAIVAVSSTKLNEIESTKKK